MKTSPFKSILDWLARRLLGSEENLTPEFAAAYVDAINTAVRDCWERDFWPAWTVLEERFFRLPWAAGTYAAGSEVYYTPGTTYYRALVSTNAVPGTDATKWEIPGVNGALPLDRYISLTQTGKTVIDKVMSIATRDPELYPGAAGRVGFGISRDGIQVRASAPFGCSYANSVWLTFRLSAPKFTSALYDAGTTYAAGALVYYPLSGECWSAVQATTGVTPGTDLTHWTQVELPYALAEAVKKFAYSELLEDDGQQDKASGIREDAEDLLALEWSKEEGQQGQVRRFDVLCRCP